jgi:hypothetical protein
VPKFRELVPFTFFESGPRRSDASIARVDDTHRTALVAQGIRAWKICYGLSCAWHLVVPELREVAPPPLAPPIVD